MVDLRRTQLLNDKPVQAGAVLYWLQRDQRVEDNWALLYAAQCASAAQQPLLVAFNLVPRFGDTTLRHYDFMFKGLLEVETSLRSLGIPFYLCQGQPEATIPDLVREHSIGQVVTDFNPLQFTTTWRTKVAKALEVQLIEVDAHNIIPVWVASPKLEFAAYTLRPKIHRLLPEFLTKFTKIQVEFQDGVVLPSVADWGGLLDKVVTNRAVGKVEWLKGGAKAAHKNLAEFCIERLPAYADRRNDPNDNQLSHLSPYLHFGQLSAQRIALEVSGSDAPRESKDAYLEELIVRRELADNYCFYNSDYDNIKGAPAWAQKTIAEHAGDTREHIYTREQFESATTHDDLWNAAQQQMVKEGKMHGFMRMYWAKKILEWTPDVQTAIDIALYLNDKYELDGTDPNGITGIMWSMCGVHDRAWNERPIFGKIRYMNYAGCKRKFAIKNYIVTYRTGASLSLLT